VTESEWLAATRPYRMLEAVQAGGTASDRKLRLFSAACVRRIWHVVTDHRGRTLVELAERFVDGLASDAEVSGACKVFVDAHENKERAGAGSPDPMAYACVAHAGVFTARLAAAAAAEFAECVGHMAAEAVIVTGPGEWPPAKTEAWESAVWAERAVQSALLRDILGNPFRPPPAIDPAFLTWNAGTVARLAQAAYDNRLLPSGELDPARQGVLADALEEAGCTDVELLGHLRGPGPHVRGCWAVDLLLGRT
jgi:hypothetical protein